MININVFKKYLVNILYSVDQLVNTVLLGDPDETISSRLGKLKRECGGKIPWSYPVCRCVDWFLDCIDKNHSIEAIEEEVGEKAIIKNRKEKKKCKSDTE